MTQRFASSEPGPFGKMLNYLTSLPSNNNDTTDYRRQYVMEALDDSSLKEPPVSPPTWVPPQHSLLFETTTRKLHQHRTSLQKHVLLKRLYGKLQTTKRHGIIMLSAQQQPTRIHIPTPSTELAYLRNAGHQKYYQRQMNVPLLSFSTPIQRKRVSPPSPISPPLKSSCNGDDDDNVPLGTLIPHQQQFQQKQLHRIGICVV
ncbi:hypothetical protein BC941DRAFT_435132 [Chlamydoabsidia padenii]|nr:hypothetical protein BC941DRAFT_435132 [Chlamydoabsidia padenii]